jgi:uncharacterized Zn-finger protein
MSGKPYSCEICNKSFSTNKYLLKHNITPSHMKRLEWKSNGFENKIQDEGVPNLDLNKEAIEEEEDGYESFVKEEDIEVNIKEEDTEVCINEDVKKYEKPGNDTNLLFSCKICNKSFPRKSKLISHERVHSGERPFKCDVCEKTYKENGALTKHKLIHTGEQEILACNICEKTFSSKSSLITHVKIHSGVKPYKCDYCDETFKAQITLDNHKRIHTGEKPFPCEICGESFSQISFLTAHKRLHLVVNVKSYSCEVCKIPFKTLSDLLMHKKSAEHMVLLETKQKVCRDEFKFLNSTNEDAKIYIKKEIMMEEESSEISGDEINVKDSTNVNIKAVNDCRENSNDPDIKEECIEEVKEEDITS